MHAIGRYEILEQLGEGASAITYRAYDPVEEEEVAIKEFKDPSLGIKALRAEVRPLKRVRHPNVIKYKDCNYFQNHDARKVLYIAMELAKQGAIRAHLESLPADTAVAWCKQILFGLAECHRRGIIHADLKPDNVFLSDGIVKIGDFGLAHSDSVKGHWGGTPSYMAPELWVKPPELSRRTDLWAVGVTLFEMVYRRLPFQARGDIPNPYRMPDFRRAPDFMPVPGYPGLPRVIRKALEKSSAERFQSAESFLAAIENCTGFHDDALLFYDKRSGRAEIYRLAANSAMDLLRTHQWSHAWDYVTAWSDGKLAGDCLLFGQAATGWIEFYRLDASGDISAGPALDQSQSSVDQIVPIESEPDTLILRYHAAASCGEFCTFDERGAIAHCQRYEGWNSAWSRIVAFRQKHGNSKWLLFYDALNGRAEFYEVTERGDMALRSAHSGWRTTWDQILPIEGCFEDRVVLLFYDPLAQQGEFYSVEPDGEMTLLRTYEGWRNSWSRILPIYPRGTVVPLLLFYDASEGHGEFYVLDEECQLELVEGRKGWSKSWSHILPLCLGN